MSRRLFSAFIGVAIILFFGNAFAETGKWFPEVSKQKITKVKGNKEYEFKWKEKSFKIFSAKGTKPKKTPDYNYGPVIEMSANGKKQFVDLRSNFESNFITHVFQDEYNKRILVLLDWGIEGSKPFYTVLLSNDGGDSWIQAGNLPRPSPVYPPSDLEYLWMNGDGKGEAWLSSDTAQASNDANFSKDMKSGQRLVYKVTTSDGGLNWTEDKTPVYHNGLMEVKAK